MITKHSTFLCTMAAALLFGFAACSFSQGETKKDDSGTLQSTQEIEGVVSGVGNRYISVIYKIDAAQGAEYEMRLPLDTHSIKVEHIQNYKLIKAGDTVHVTYQEITKEGKEGPALSRKATIITFIKPAVIVPQSESADQGVLQIKGTKG